MNPLAFVVHTKTQRLSNVRQKSGFLVLHVFESIEKEVTAGHWQLLSLVAAAGNSSLGCRHSFLWKYRRSCYILLTGLTCRYSKRICCKEVVSFFCLSVQLLSLQLLTHIRCVAVFQDLGRKPTRWRSESNGQHTFFLCRGAFPVNLFFALKVFGDCGERVAVPFTTDHKLLRKALYEIEPNQIYVRNIKLTCSIYSISITIWFGAGSESQWIVQLKCSGTSM